MIQESTEAINYPVVNSYTSEIGWKTVERAEPLQGTTTLLVIDAIPWYRNRRGDNIPTTPTLYARRKCMGRVYDDNNNTLPFFERERIEWESLALQTAHRNGFCFQPDHHVHLDWSRL